MADEAAETAAAEKAAAEKAAKAAAEAAKAAAEAAKPAGKAKVNSVVKGTINLWPLLRLPTEDRVAKIVAGECDGVLSELAEMAAAHPTRNPKGETVTRQTVIDAVKARLRKA